MDENYAQMCRIGTVLQSFYIRTVNHIQLLSFVTLATILDSFIHIIPTNQRFVKSKILACVTNTYQLFALE